MTRCRFARTEKSPRSGRWAREGAGLAELESAGGLIGSVDQQLPSVGWLPRCGAIEVGGALAAVAVTAVSHEQKGIRARGSVARGGDACGSAHRHRGQVMPFVEQSVVSDQARFRRRSPVVDAA